MNDDKITLADIKDLLKQLGMAAVGLGLLVIIIAAGVFLLFNPIWLIALILLLILAVLLDAR